MKVKVSYILFIIIFVGCNSPNLDYDLIDNYDPNYGNDDEVFEIPFLIIDSKDLVSKLNKFENNNYIDSNILKLELELKFILKNESFKNNKAAKYEDSINLFHDFYSNNKMLKESILTDLSSIVEYKLGSIDSKNQVSSILENKIKGEHLLYKNDWYSNTEVEFSNQFIRDYFSSVGVFDYFINPDFSNYYPIFDTAYSEYINDKKIENLTIENDIFFFRMDVEDINSIDSIISIKEIELNKDYPTQLKFMKHIIKKYNEGMSITFMLPEY